MQKMRGVLRLNKREAAIITAYTGILVGSFDSLQEYIENKIGHSIWTHELGFKETWEMLKKLSKDDFMGLCRSITE